MRRAFLNRPRLVEKASGFCGLNVLTDAANPSVFFLLTHWMDADSFRVWHHSEQHHQSHELIPSGLKLDSSFTSLTIGNCIEDPAGAQNISDAIQLQTSAISRWLIRSDTLFALLLAPDGTIRARNQASQRIFPLDPARSFGLTVWDYLVCSDADRLRQRLADAASEQEDHFLLNVSNGQQNPVTLEVGIVRCSAAILLIGAQEHRHDAQFQTEILRLTNDLSVMMRESAQKNRELQKANVTIERLARTDALTGLANRRTLDEAFQREIARAERQAQSLSIVMADLDRFKSINDQYGHIAGDQVLAGAAAVFNRQLRPYDLAARYGGEEFVLLLPGTSTENAVAIAERIREEIEKTTIATCPRQITISLGVATWQRGEGADVLVARADAALYSAKTGGRNRVVVASNTRD